MNFKKLTLLPLLLILNACRAEPNFAQAQNENRLPEIKRLTAVPTAPVRQIAADKDFVYLLDENGELWETSGRRDKAYFLDSRLSSITPMSAENQNVSVIYEFKNLQTWSVWRDKAHTATYYATKNAAAPHSQAIFHSGCLIALEQGKTHTFPTRLCPIKEGMIGQAKAENVSILPDSRPILFGNNILLLGDPDSDTYPHGVLGDTIEAKTLYTLDAKTLKPTAAAFRLPENLVFENNTVTLLGDKVVAVISGGGAGARVAVLALTNGHWQIQAESTPLPINRWQSPFVFQNQLYAVQMPHLRGRLVRYAMQGKHLIEQELGDGFSNHAIGSRDTQIAAVLPDYVVIPQMGFRRLFALDSSGSLKRLEPELPAPVVRSAVQDGVSYWLLSDGSVWAWAQP